MPAIPDVLIRDVWTIKSTLTVREAARLMAEKHIGFLPVIHEDVSAGAVTDRDIVVRVVAQNKDPDQTLIGDVVSTADTTGNPPENVNSGLITLPETTSVDEATRIMDEKQIRRVGVHDSDLRLVGIVSRADLPSPEAVTHA